MWWHESVVGDYGKDSLHEKSCKVILFNIMQRTIIYNDSFKNILPHQYTNKKGIINCNKNFIEEF